MEQDLDLERGHAVEVRRTSLAVTVERDGAATAPSETSRPLTVPSALWTQYREAEDELFQLPTYDTLKRYKRAVQELVRRALSAHRATTDMRLSQRGGFKRLVYVQAVEQSLDEFTPDKLREWQGVRLLQRLDLVRGLLVDLFA